MDTLKDATMTIGEKLEEARKRKGVSIREAAEATKIRSDFLLSLEANRFDIPLPEIYVRGFLKNYAHFLRIDADRVMTDFDAMRLGQNSLHIRHLPTHGEGEETKRESLGRMQLPGKEESTSGVPNRGVTEEPREPAEEERGIRESSPRLPGTDPELRALYLKLGLFGAGALVLLLLIGLLVRQIRTDDPPPPAPTPSTVVQPAEPVPATPATTAGTLSLTASESVSVMINRADDNSRIFSGTLAAGETRSFDTTGPVVLRFTNGEALQVERNGSRFRIGITGAGARRID